MTNLQFLFVTLLAGAASNRYTLAESKECPIECAPNGECVNGECQCYQGFAGADCSFPFEQCPDDKTMCFDGAQCLRISEKGLDGKRQDGYICDCNNLSDASPFQIAECESPDSQVCEKGHPTSDYAFCTNGGQCAAMIQQGEPHAGCICPDDFEGRHCQYRKGTAPDAELKAAYQEKRSHLSGGLLCFVLIIVFGVVGYIGYKFYTNRRQKDYDSQEHTKIESTIQDLEVTKSAEEEEDNHELALTANDDDDDSLIVEVTGVPKGEMS